RTRWTARRTPSAARAWTTPPSAEPGARSGSTATRPGRSLAGRWRSSPRPPPQTSRYPPDPDAPGGIGHVFRTGQPETVEELTDDMLVKGARDEDHLRLVRSVGLRATICVPLVVSGKPFGGLTFATAEPGRQEAPSAPALR